MTTVVKLLASLSLLACLPATASATGGLDCAIDDANLEFHYEALFSYSDNAPLLQSKAEFKARQPNVPQALRSLDQGALRLIQQWFEAKDLRLQFYSETPGAAGSLKLTIETVVEEDELSYSGTYRLEIQPGPTAGQSSDPINVTGKASCSAG